MKRIALSFVLAAAMLAGTAQPAYCILAGPIMLRASPYGPTSAAWQAEFCGMGMVFQLMAGFMDAIL